MEFDYNPSTRKATMKGDLFNMIRDEFSVVNEAKKFGRALHAPDRKYQISPVGSFPPALLYEIKRYIKRVYPHYTFDVSERLRGVVRPYIKTETITDLAADQGKALHGYQKEAIRSALNIGRGVIEVGTSGGKTLIAANLIQTLYNKNPNLKFLFLTPDVGLTTQAYGDFMEYNSQFTFGKWTGKDKFDRSNTVTICNVQIMQRTKDKSIIEYLYDNIDVIIIDEVHGIKPGNKSTKMVNNFRTNNKFGLTGTVPENDTDENKHNRWCILGNIGPIIHCKPGHELRAEGYSANAEVRIIKLYYSSVPTTDGLSKKMKKLPTANYQAELDFITSSHKRNKTIAQICNKLDRNILITVDRLQHGETLYNLLKMMCPDRRVYFIRGDVEVHERERIKRIMEVNDDVIVVAMSKIFSTGISVNNLFYIIPASGGKSRTKIVQTIGRGLRKYKGKDKVVIIDIADMLTYGSRHLTDRKRIYKNEKIKFKEKKMYVME